MQSKNPFNEHLLYSDTISLNLQRMIVLDGTEESGERLAGGQQPSSMSRFISYPTGQIKLYISDPNLESGGA